MANDPFVTNLSCEHQKVQGILSLVETQIATLETSKLEAWYLDFEKTIHALSYLLGGLHHKKEEKLFEYLATTKFVREGGSQCGYYFGLFLSHNDKMYFRNLAIQKKVDISNIHELSLKENSCTAIPREEHEAAEIAHKLLLHQAAIVSQLQKSSEDFKVYKGTVEEIGRRYLRLMRLHIEKEEKCLFPAANFMLERQPAPDLMAFTTELENLESQKMQELNQTFWEIATRMSYGGQLGI